MQRVDMDTAFRRVRDIRLALAALLVLSMTANLALTVGFAGRETVTVLVPAAVGPAWEVGGSAAGAGRAGARYLEDMARTVAVSARMAAKDAPSSSIASQSKARPERSSSMASPGDQAAKSSSFMRMVGRSAVSRTAMSSACDL